MEVSGIHQTLKGLRYMYFSLSLSTQEEDVCTVLCCENKHVGWHSLGNLDPESARSRESNLVSVCTELEFVGYTRFRHAEVFVGVRYRTHVLRSCHQYVIIPNIDVVLDGHEGDSAEIA